MTATRRNYIKCLSTSCVICRYVTIFSENFLNEWRKLSQDVLISYMLHILHKLPYNRRRKAYRLSQMIKRSFQQDVHSGTLYRNLINLQLHPTTTLFPKVLRGPMVAHSRLFEFKTPHISKFSWSWVKQKTTTKFNTTQFVVSLFHDRAVSLTHVKDLHARIVHVIVTSGHFSAVEYSVENFLSIFGSTKIVSDQVWDQTTITLQRDRTPFWNSVQVVGHILAFVPPPQIRTLRQWRDFEQWDKLIGEGRYGRMCLNQV